MIERKQTAEPIVLRGHRDTFVDPGPAPVAPARRGEVLPPTPAELATPAGATSVVLKTTYTDRAVGFRISTVPLACVAGAVMALIAVVGRDYPVFSVMVLFFFGLGFGAAWLVSWLWYLLLSPDGAAILSIFLHFRLLRHEQAARLRRMENRE